MVEIVTGCALGAFLGVRHALEPDHLAAVSTLVAERPRPRQAALLGALWGIGHAASLLVVGVTLIALRGELPARAVTAAEALVAVMLIVLGVRSLWIASRASRSSGHGAGRRSRLRLTWLLGGTPSSRFALAPPGPAPAVGVPPLLIGVVHGLAGSGALTALAVTEMPTTAGALGYMAAFCLGSVAAMAAVSGAAGASLGRVVRSDRGRAALVGAAGVVSVGVGVVWGAMLLAPPG